MTARSTPAQSTARATGQQRGGARKRGAGARGGSGVADAVDRDLAAIRKRAPELADSALAALALSLAREIDDADNSATAKAACGRTMHEALATLRALTPAEEAKDKVSDIGRKRAQRRRARGAAAADPSRT
jgi:hypothetical protein